nr:VOC family protein [Chitinophaga qingshengii]
MNKQIQDIHHITAIAADAQRNYDFYARVPGLRMVKKRNCPRHHTPLKTESGRLVFS